MLKNRKILNVGILCVFIINIVYKNKCYLMHLYLLLLCLIFITTSIIILSKRNNFTSENFKHKLRIISLRYKEVKLNIFRLFCIIYYYYYCCNYSLKEERRWNNKMQFRRKILIIYC